MKKYLILSVLSIFGVCCGLSALADENVKLVDKIVAVVNENVVLLSELENQTLFFKNQLTERNIPLPPDATLQKQVLERLIIEQLQLEEAESRGIQVDDVMLNAAVKQMAGQNQMTLEEFRQRLLSEGHDYIQFREELRKDIMINQVRQRAVSSRILISDQEVDDYLRNEKIAGEENIQFLVSHIMISIPEAANPEVIEKARKRAEKVYNDLQAGQDFARLAITESEGHDALDGGSLGWRQLNQLPSIFAKTVATLKKGDFSKSIRSPSGFHILKLEDKKGENRHITPQVHARHILIIPNAVVSEDDARKKLNDLRERILQGENFAELAKVHSEDPGSAVNNGNLGWSTPDVYVPQFRKIVETLPINKISEPFKSDYGWHIAEVLGRREHDDTDEYRRNLARRYIFERKAAEEEELWIRRLRDEAYIDYRTEDKKS